MSRERIEVVVAGHVCLDLIPEMERRPLVAAGGLQEIGPLTIRAGGSVANTGLDLAALGTPVRLVANVGSDSLGRLLIELLRQPGVDNGAVRVVEGETSYSIVLHPDGDERAFWHHVGANGSFDGSRVEVVDLGILHVGYPTALPALHADRGAGLIGLLGRAQAAGVTTSVDLATFDDVSSAARQDWPALLRRVLPLTDILAASLDDLRCVLGDAVVHRDPSSLASDLVERGVAIALVKLGPDGLVMATGTADRFHRAGRALALTPSWADQRLRAPSLDVDVLTTTGAGDAAVAGLLHGVVRGMGPVEALGAAARTAAARVSTQGPLPAWAELVRRLPDVEVADDAVDQRGTRC